MPERVYGDYRMLSARYQRNGRPPTGERRRAPEAR